MDYATHIKTVLEKLIDDLYQRKSDYCNDPERDFTRNRKLGFKDMVKLLISIAKSDNQCHVEETAGTMLLRKASLDI